ncbi:hypothetical protein ACFQ8C_33140 [Streptomyces sp. NPDC056503]|uniref:hypothetical protein n=1 Tax=Streptomyces sp. NPDC056503 TaxID=3345842 RepID=UPI00367E81A8
MSGDTEERLRSALAGLAETVPDPPDAYRRARQQWRRRDMKRRALTAAIVLVVVVIACAVGLWALSGASPGRHVIFNAGVQEAADGPGVIRTDGICPGCR